MSTTVKVQVPMDKSLRDALAARADALGFDSVQAFIRVLAKAQVDNRTIDFNAREWPQPSPAVATRLQREAAEARELAKSGRTKGHFTTTSLMEDLLSDEAH